jgi:methylglutaconyl-CoA hydratase
MSAELVLQMQDRIARLTLDRAAKRNAMTPAMRSAFATQLEAWSRDRAVRVLVIDGNGPDFCAGSDMGRAGEQGARERLAPFAMLARFPKPAIACVQGACIGAAVALVAACDVVLAAPSAFFSLPETRFGFSPGALVPLLRHGLGERGFRRYALGGERFDASTAQTLGLVHELCEDPLQRGLEVAGEFLCAAPGAMAAVKKDIAEALARAVEASIDAEAALLQTEEAREGLAALRERRRPAWNQENPS